MANRFTRWAPSQYVPLPIDYYQSALAFKEQKTAAALDKINAILSGYGSIEPISADPQALYDETTARLRKDIEGITKQDLETPAANRAVNRILNDPATVNAYDQVLTDALYGAQAKKDLNEYLKKNPEVNAAEYLSKFTQLGLEEGKSKNFNPNRFKNMPVLSDYYDLNKRIEEGVARLHQDSRSLQDIVFNDKTGAEYYVNGKVTQLGEDKIRRYVISQLSTDPLAKAQMAKNVRYAGYQMDPTNVDAGVNKLGEAYRDTLIDRGNDLADKLTALYGNLTPAQIDAKRKDPKDKSFRTKELDIQNGMEALKAYRNDDGSDWVDPKTLAAMNERDKLVGGFDAFAWKETEDGKKYSPWWLAQQQAAMAFSYRKKLKEMDNDSMIKRIMTGMATYYDQRNQTPISEEDYSGYIQNIPGLSSVKLNGSGMLEPGNYKDQFNVTAYERTGRPGPDKVAGYYRPEDVMIKADDNTVIPTGWEKVGSYSVGAGYKPIYAKPGAVKQKSEKIDEGKGYDKGKEQIREFLTQQGAIKNYDLDNSADMKRAIQDIVNFNRQVESVYTPVITDMASGSPTRINRIKENLNFTNVYKLKKSGQLELVGEDAKGKIRKHLGDEKAKGPLVPFQPVSMSGKAYDVVSVGNETFYVEGTMQDQILTARANATVGEMMKPGDPVRTLSDGSLFLKFMGKNEQTGRNDKMYSGIIPGGSSAEAQGILKATWDANVSKVMAEGNMPKDQAEKALLNELKPDGSPSVIISSQNGARIVVDTPVGTFSKPGNKTPVYYSWGGGGKYQFQGGRQAIGNSIQDMQSTFNEQRMYDIMPFLRAATKEQALGVGGDDALFSDILSKTMYEQ